MTPTRLIGVATAAAVTVGLAAPIVASAQGNSPSSNIVETVLDVSGSEGFDRNGRDYDLLRDALLATGLADAVATTDDITVFAPNDRAFILLARDLGYRGFDEAGALAFLVDFTGFESAANPGLLDDVLLYHVLPGAQTRRELNRGPAVPTLLGPEIEVVHNFVVDGDPNDPDAYISFPRNVRASNGIIHTVNRVLRPIDLERPAPSKNIVEIVIDASGAEGTDRDGHDYDLLREALVATGLADAVATTDDITVFAPNDWAFIRLARDLGYPGWDEAGALGFLIEATGFESAEQPGILDDVLLYHVAPGAQTLNELRFDRDVETLLDGATFDVTYWRVIDNDRDDTNAIFRRPSNIEASNGIVHTVNQVLRPIDL